MSFLIGRLLVPNPNLIYGGCVINDKNFEIEETIKNEINKVDVSDARVGESDQNKRLGRELALWTLTEGNPTNSFVSILINVYFNFPSVYLYLKFLYFIHSLGLALF